MSIRLGHRYAIMLAKDAKYPAPIAFYLAHELGHIALGHLQDGAAIVDLSDPLRSPHDGDEEERAADQFALELLTGMKEPKVDAQIKRFTAEQLAASVLKTSTHAQIEPGTLALCYGYTTDDWVKTNATMRSIYSKSLPAWGEVNGIAQSQLVWGTLPDDLDFFLHAVIGIR